MGEAASGRARAPSRRRARAPARQRRSSSPEPAARPPVCALARVADGYDTHYTERYMGMPQDNPEGYARSSVMAHIPLIADSARLLIVHGLLDENVHFRHTVRLINELIHHKKQYELLVFPNERHTPRGKPDRIYMEQRIADFFKQSFVRASNGVNSQSQD